MVFGARYNLPEITPGSWAAFLIRYDYDFAAKRPGDSGRWFLPFNFMVGKMPLDETVTETGCRAVNG
jgi:hypothetical protein